MRSEEFRDELNQRSDSELLEICLRDSSAPYVFEPEPVKWIAFCDFLSTQLGVTHGDIRVVGSGRFGFSTKPGKNLKAFTPESDIDVVVVNAAAFDALWYSLLRAAYPRPPISVKPGGWLASRRNELYTGWLTPVAIPLDLKIYGPKARPVIDFRLRWFNAMKLASQIAPRPHEDVTSRLYRTWEHAELYHKQSIMALRKSLIE